ncbi:hypothetical protein KUCAC02_012302 [Chaenocephalus aceratus]|uniref:Uncharacterized protein n=1 Tax=Chaenocephalus aceratus TaxID=36190 RepID=A0ACB9XBU5_CHAAC|nr:hypothetical protein KUCAC02_012302 [Chaenocephalus aceratus]
MQGMQSLQGDSEGTEGERQGAVSTTHPSTLSLHQHLGCTSTSLCWVLWVHCTVKEWACSPPGRVGNGWVS